MDTNRLDLRTRIIQTDGTMPEVLEPINDSRTGMPWPYQMFSVTQPEIVCSNRPRNLVARVVDDPHDGSFTLLDENDEEDELVHALPKRMDAMHVLADIAQSLYLRHNPELVAGMNEDEMRFLLMPSEGRAELRTRIGPTTWTSAIPLFVVRTSSADEYWPIENVTVLDAETDLAFLRSLDHANLIRLVTDGERVL